MITATHNAIRHLFSFPPYTTPKQFAKFAVITRVVTVHGKETERQMERTSDIGGRGQGPIQSAYGEYRKSERGAALKSSPTALCPSGSYAVEWFTCQP